MDSQLKNIFSQTAIKSSLRSCLIIGKINVLLSSWGGWHPVSWRHICSEYLDVCNTHINTQSGMLDMFCPLPCVCFLLHCNTLPFTLLSSLPLSPFPSESDQSLRRASSFWSLIFTSDSIFASPTLPFLLWHHSSGTDPHPQGVHLPLKHSRLLPSSVTHPHPPSTSTLCACVLGATSLQKNKILGAVCTHPSHPLSHPFCNSGNVNSSGLEGRCLSWCLSRWDH